MNAALRPAARSDVLKQFAYLLREATPTVALRFRTQVEIAVREAAEMPQIGTPVFLEGKGLPAVRSWPIPTFPAIRLYYVLHADGIQVLRVLHGRRDIPNALLSI